jgi:hypothetical protein
LGGLEAREVDLKVENDEPENLRAVRENLRAVNAEIAMGRVGKAEGEKSCLEVEIGRGERESVCLVVKVGVVVVGFDFAVDTEGTECRNALEAEDFGGGGKKRCD